MSKYVKTNSQVVTYHAKLVGNANKIAKLESLHSRLQEMSKFMHENWDWSDKTNCKFSPKIYKAIRKNFPDVHSKLVQKAMKEYGKFGEAERPKNPVSLPITWDYQQFDTKFNKGYYKMFVKFSKTNFPVEGKRTINLVRNRKIQEVRVKKIDNGFRVYFVCRIENPANEVIKPCNSKVVGLDANVKSVVLSNNQFFNLNPIVHLKQEARKKKFPIRYSRFYVKNFTKNYLDQVSNRIVESLVKDGAEVLLMEDLTGLREKQTEKHNSWRERELRFILNACYPYAMLQAMLQYKCVQKGIKVKFISPAYTSQKCSKCGSLETRRPTQNRFECSDCGLHLNADLNGARNIASAICRGNEHMIDSARHANKSA